MAEQTGLSTDEVIRLHAGTEYVVYAIGFCPGFPYLGYLPPPLCGVPRLPTPRLRVEAGSVGLTGRQTGVYTLAAAGRLEPGRAGRRWCWSMWRTGTSRCAPATGWLRRIDEAEYRRLEGERL